MSSEGRGRDEFKGTSEFKGISFGFARRASSKFTNSKEELS